MTHKFVNTAQTLTFGHQDVSLTELINYGDYRLRMSIRSDSYKSQSHARLECFDKQAMKWNEVVTRPALDMMTEEGLVYMPATKKATAASFKEDRTWLLTQFSNLVD